MFCNLAEILRWDGKAGLLPSSSVRPKPPRLDGIRQICQVQRKPEAGFGATTGLYADDGKTGFDKEEMKAFEQCVARPEHQPQL